MEKSPTGKGGLLPPLGNSTSRARHRRRFVFGFLLVLSIGFWTMTRGAVPFLWPTRPYRGSYRPDIPQDQQAHLEEVADLLHDIYRTLAEMRYLDPVDVHPGPHDIANLQAVYEGKEIDPAIMYLYSIMPYVDAHDAPNKGFLNGFVFVDFRKTGEAARGRNPFFVGSSSDYESPSDVVPPWATPLFVSPQGGAVIYDARQQKIWIVTSEGSRKVDPKDYEQLPSWPAADLLRDTGAKFRGLQFLPGGVPGLCTEEWEHRAEVDGRSIDGRALYRKHGWPDNFDGDAFEIDHVRELAAIKAIIRARKPLSDKAVLKTLWEAGKSALEQTQRQLAQATTLDEEWTARFRLWQAETNTEKRAADFKLAEQETERVCPGEVCLSDEDLPLWEAELLRVEYGLRQNDVKRNQQNLEKASGDNSDDEARWRTLLRLGERRAVVYDMALEASKRDAERLRPGETFKGVSGRVSLDGRELFAPYLAKESMLDKDRRRLSETREWAKQIPEEATGALEEVQDVMDLYEANINASLERQQLAAKHRGASPGLVGHTVGQTE